MELTADRTQNEVTLRVRGRLDSYWASHFSSELDRIVREGSNTITLDFSEVDFLSSAGIGVIMRQYNAISGMRGTLRIVHPQPLVRSVLAMTGLEKYLVDDSVGEGPVRRETLAVSDSEQQSTFEAFDSGGRTFSIASINPDGGMQLGVFGDPAKLPAAAYTESEAQSVSFTKNELGVGIGAFGSTFDESRSRFGEFLSLGGCTAFMPSDDTNIPDYLIEEKAYTPSMLVLYGIRCKGTYSHFIRFEPPPDKNPIDFPSLLDAVFERTGFDSLAIGMVAESAGLMGATLKRSPALGAGETQVFEYPGIRHWLSFTAEPAHAQTLTVVSGVATKRASESYAHFLRQDGPGRPLQHFHAMPCAIQPLGLGVLDLHETVCGLVRHSPPLDILHLLHDNRRVVGSGASAFLRGAVWVAPIRGITS